jgi:hypothetical protein
MSTSISVKIFFLLVCCLLAGCETSTDNLVGSCARFAGKYGIAYVGGALGEGEIELVVSPERADLLEGRLTLWDETGTNATLHLAGPGTCDQNIVHLTFGSGDHPEARVRVIGGVATLVPPRDRIPELFGVWEVKVVVKADDQTRTIKGFIREAKQSS